MDAQQQTERPEPTQTAAAQPAARQASGQIGIEPAQAGAHNAITLSERSAVLKPPAFRQRMRQKMLPETTWLAELMREAGPHFGGRTPRQWRELLNHPNPHIQQEARRAYRDLPPLAQCILTAGAYVKALEYANNVGSITGVLVIVGMITSGIAGGWNGLAIGVSIAAVFAAIMTGYTRTEPRQALAKDLLDSAQDARLIPFLTLRLIRIGNDSRRRRKMFAGRNLRNALVRLLPFVQEADAAEWTGTHWHCLLRCLHKPYRDIELTEAVLRTMARVGNEEAYRAIKGMGLEPSVEECLTTGKKRAARQANQQFLTQVKQECLPVLEARLHEQRQVQTLLRPSSSASVTTSGSDVLLRPAQAYLGETPAEQLLRPQSPE